MKQSIKQKYSTFVQGIQKVARSVWSHSWIVLMDWHHHQTLDLNSCCLFKCAAAAGPIPARERPGPLQHRRSGHLCRTGCYSLPEKFRSNLYAVKRHNIQVQVPPQPRLSTCHCFKLSIGITYSTYFTYFAYCGTHILYILHICS